MIPYRLLLRYCIVCRINNTAAGRQQQLILFAEPDLTFVAAVKMVQSWETPESNAKDLQRLQQRPNMMVK